jgi:hypothetical protein
MPRYNTQLMTLMNYLNGREDQEDDVGAVSRYVASHYVGLPRPAKDSEASLTFVYRWEDIDDIRTHARHYGPTITQSQIDAAVAAAGIVQ